MTEDDKNRYEEKLKKLIKDIHPIPQLGQQLRIDFVPIAEDTLDKEGWSNQS